MQMEKHQSQLTERILNVTLEIIFVLTGEDYGPVKKCNENVKPVSNHQVSGGCSSTLCPLTQPPTHSLIHESNNEKILKLTNKIIHLLTGEVPIRCQDVAVYFSMEEWEYLEEHNDLYKDNMITSPDLPRATYGLGDFHTHVFSPLHGKNEHSFLTTVQEARRSSLDEQNMANHWDKPLGQATSCEARCLSSNISSPTGTQITYWRLCNDHVKGCKNSIGYRHHVFLDHTYAIKTHKKLLLDEVRNFTVSDIPTPTSHTSQYLTSQWNEVPHLYDGGSLTYSSLHTPVCPVQYTAVHVKEETDDMQEYQCSIKVEPPSCDAPNLTVTELYTSTDLTKGQFSIKEEPVSYDYHENTAIYPSVDHTQQYTAHNFKEEQPSEIDIYLPADTQDTNSSKAEIDIYLPTETLHTNRRKDVHRKHTPQHKLLDKPFLCAECGKRFVSKSGLSTHKKIHVFRKQHTCTECGKSFLSHLYLSRHQKIHSGEKTYSCEECGKWFLKASYLTVHRKVHRKIGPFSCDKCGKCFHSNSGLSNHQKTHGIEKPFACSECDKWFSSKSELDDHRRFHSGEKTFSCPDCGKSFIKEQNLVNHQRLHMKKNPFSCIECGKLFTSNTYLIRHMELHTRKKTSYPCPTCGKYFNSNLDLIIHQRIHTAGKSGTSSEWRNCFIRKLGFVIHQRNHAKKKSLSCPECKETFAKKTQLIHHQKVHSEKKSVSA